MGLTELYCTYIQGGWARTFSDEAMELPVSINLSRVDLSIEAPKDRKRIRPSSQTEMGGGQSN